MIPTIIQLGPIAISFWGILILLGLFFGSFLVWKKTKEEYYEEDKVMDGILLISLIALLISRTWYVLSNWNNLQAGFFTWFDWVGKPGFAWEGTIIGGTVVLIAYTKKQKWDFFKIADLSSFGLVLGTAFYYLGAFFNGSPDNQKINLPALIQFILMLFILKLLYYFDKHYRTYTWYKNKRGEAVPGFLFLAFLLLWSSSKLILALIQNNRLYLSSGQFFTLLVIVASLVCLFYRTGRSIKEIWLKFDKPKRNSVPPTKIHLKSGMEAK